MQRDIIVAILGKLKTAYPKFYANMTKKEAEETISLWQYKFNEEDANMLNIAIDTLIDTFTYPPTIADVKKEILKLKTIDELQTIDYWNEAYKMICNGIYMTEEKWEQCSEICKRYFGSLSRLKEKAKTEGLNMEVEQSLFEKTVRAIKDRKNQDMMISQETKIKLKELTSKIKMLGD